MLITDDVHLPVAVGCWLEVDFGWGRAMMNPSSDESSDIWEAMAGCRGKSSVVPSEGSGSVPYVSLSLTG